MRVFSLRTTLVDESGRGFEEQSQSVERLPHITELINAPNNRIGPTKPHIEVVGPWLCVRLDVEVKGICSLVIVIRREENLVVEEPSQAERRLDQLYLSVTGPHAKLTRSTSTTRVCAILAISEAISCISLAPHSWPCLSLYCLCEYGV